MREYKEIATFTGHKVGNKFKPIIRFYENQLQPWSFLVYDEVYNCIYSIPKEEVYGFVFAVLIKERRLFTSGEEMEKLFHKIWLPKDHALVVPYVEEKICFLKREYSLALDNGEIDFRDVCALSYELAKEVDWRLPHPCVDIKNTVTNTVHNLMITVPEYKSIVLANPKYFNIKSKTR